MLKPRPIPFWNHPLRYQGMSFYQSGFDNNDTTTILQVVQNPSWLIPYISCALIAFESTYVERSRSMTP